MAQEATESEPTMEEILASIRRIIDEDEQPAEEAAAEEAPAAEAEPEPEVEAAHDDVLELTDRVEEPAGGTEPLAVEDDLMIIDREEDEVAPEPAPEPEPEPVAEAPMPEPEPEPVAAARERAPEPQMDEDALLDQTAASAAAGAFSALNENLKVASGDGTTLETIVRELMRPMLKQWLDTNLPRIVEEKVEAEIARVSRRR
ncbi:MULTISPECIES: PopZ family protein [Hyphobacterium]|uniref:PopZ family protein n=1 Tax=Hyphobacterium vulgare TaxID=1736751 RepID=A0ABV6ZUM5_9PROT